MTKPVRLQLSRRKGFNLQAASRALNGLEAVNVTRRGRYGNQFKIGEHGDRAACVAQHRAALEDSPTALAGVKAQLRGKNVACTCGLDELCHGDTLLELANR